MAETAGADIVYVTASLPYGAGEAFILAEIRALEALGCRVMIVPIRRTGRLVHGEASHLHSVARPIISVEIAVGALRTALGAPRRALAAVRLLGGSRSAGVLLKNLAVVPKAFWLAGLVRRSGASHVHAHWASTSSTTAMVASRLAGISWSFTAHRWDIGESNLLGTKARTACFTRAISGHGAGQLRELVGDHGFEPWVLPMGVELPVLEARLKERDGPLRVLTAANLVEVKGHVHLIEAIRLLRERGVDVRADLAGAGPLADWLARVVDGEGLDEHVRFLGVVSHDELLERMRGGEWDAAVLASVVTPSGEIEGIPVSLVEAMACGLPAVGTTTGGVPELLCDGAGILVPPGDPTALADALGALAEDTTLRARLGAAGRARVEERFDVNRVAAELATRFRDCAGPQAFKSA